MSDLKKNGENKTNPRVYSIIQDLFLFLSPPFDLSGKRLDEKIARAQEKDGEQKKSHEIANNNKIRAETENQIKNFVFFIFVRLRCPLPLFNPM